MKHLHIWRNEKFTNSYIEFINKHFNQREHLFIIIGSGIGAPITQEENVIEVSDNTSGYIRLIKEMNECDNIHLHSLFNMKVVTLLFLQPWLLKKCYWIVWGGDLYVKRKPRLTIKAKVKEVLRGFVIKRMGHIVTLVKGDYELAKDWYGVRGTYYHGAYVNPISKGFLDSLPEISKSEKKPIVIQVGNSADSANNHLDALNKLKHFKNQDILIYVPLSYGDKTYAEFIIKEGEKIFGEKFIPLTEFLPPHKYTTYLNNIDVAIFNNNRQQALGNIYALLYLKRKVFIRSDTSMWAHFKEKLEIDMDDFLSVENLNFEQFMRRNDAQNTANISDVFEEEYLADIWEEIFNNKC